MLIKVLYSLLGPRDRTQTNQRRIAVLLTTTLTVIAVGCGGGTAFSPTQLPPPCKPKSTQDGPNHLYTTDNDYRIFAYQLPLSPSSKPIAALVTSNPPNYSSGFRPGALVVSQDNLYVDGLDYSSPPAYHVYVYALPLTSSSSPSQILTSPGENGNGIAADSAGTIYDSVYQGVNVYPLGATSPAYTLATETPYGLTVDSADRLFLNFDGVDKAGIIPAPINSGSYATEFSRDDFVGTGIATDSCDDLYVDGFSPGTGGSIDIYHPPYSSTSKPASEIHIADEAYQMQIASDGTMYIGTNSKNSKSGGQIDVLFPPYTKVSLGVLVQSVVVPFGIATGQ